MFRKFFDKQIEKEIKKLEEHPELNTNQSQKTADMIRYCIVLFLVAVLILLWWYDAQHPEINIFPRFH